MSSACLNFAGGKVVFLFDEAVRQYQVPSAAKTRHPNLMAFELEPAVRDFLNFSALLMFIQPISAARWRRANILA